MTALNAGAEITRAARSLFPFSGPDGHCFFRLRSYGRGARRSRLCRGRRGGLLLVPLWNPALLSGDAHQRDQEEQPHQGADKDEEQAIEIQAEMREEIRSDTDSGKHHDQRANSYQSEHSLFLRHRKVCFTPFAIELRAKRDSSLSSE